MKTTLLLPAAVLIGGLVLPVQAQITDELVVHLPFDNNYSNTRANGVTATAVGNPSFTAGKIGSGAVTVTTRKDGSDFSYVTLGNPAELAFGGVTDGTATDFTVAFWVSYTNQTSDPALISNKDWASSNNQGWGIFAQGGGNLRINTTDDRGSSGKQDTSATPNIRDGAWHHVAVVFVRTNALSVYIDGALRTTSSLVPVTGPIDSFYPLNLGQDGTGSYTDGGSAEIVANMDDVGIWRRALSAGEIAAVVNAGLGGTNIAAVPSIANPFVKSTSPTQGAAAVAPNAAVSVVVTDGLNQLDTNTAKLLINGTQVPVTFAKSGPDTTISYTPTALHSRGANQASLIFGSSAATLFTNTWSYTVAAYVTLSPDLKVTADTTKPGFRFSIFANSGDQANTFAKADAALSGQLIDENGNERPNLADPTAQGIASAQATAPNPANAPISFEIPTVINLDAVGGSTSGAFTPDDQMPGVPAQDGLTDGLATEIITFLELPAGLTTMVVASDDGFRTTVGKPAQDALKSLIAGQFEGGRGVAPTTFYLDVPEAGVYPFRLVHENGNGTANVEWYTVKPDGSNVLVNDVANGGIRAYRATTTAMPAYVKYINPTPVPRQLNLPSSTLTVVLADGSTPLDDASIQLKIDGAVVGTKTRSGNLVTLNYTPTGIMFPADPHQVELSFKDTGGSSNSIKSTLMNLKNVVLPNPVIFDSFDSYAEGGVPTGWTETNFTATSTAGIDIDNLDSDSYKPWVVVSADRLQGLKGRIFNGPLANQMSNGVPVTLLAAGNMLYAESDVRDGSQVQFLYTKPYDLSNVTNAAIGLSVLYEQNQDNIGAIEYSIDGGKTWLPVVYYLDFLDGGGDIRLSPDGSVDAVATLNNPNADTADWTENGVAKGDTYGSGIAAPITQALGRFIAPRANDNSSEGKRFEIFRLEQAGRKSDVRLRFAQLGTASWYFGFDNLGFYDVPTAAPVTEQPVRVLTINKVGETTLSLSWTGDGGTLQEASNLNGPWSDSANQANPQNITVGTGNRFYRVAP